MTTNIYFILHRKKICWPYLIDHVIFFFSKDVTNYVNSTFPSFFTHSSIQNNIFIIIIIGRHRQIIIFKYRFIYLILEIDMTELMLIINSSQVNNKKHSFQNIQLSTRHKLCPFIFLMSKYTTTTNKFFVISFEWFFNDMAAESKGVDDQSVASGRAK